MKSATRNILIIVGLVLVGFVGIISYGVYRAYTFFNSISESVNKEVPPELQEAKILKDEGFLQKSEFFKLKKLSFAETVAKGSQAKDEKERVRLTRSETAKGIYGFDDIKVCGDEIIAVGKFGGFVFDKNGDLKREIYFEPKVIKIKVFSFEREHYLQTLDDLRIVDLKNDGNCEFISESPLAGVTIFDNQGNLAWKYGEIDYNFGEGFNKSDEEIDKEVSVTKIAIGDLNDDGISEYIISAKNDGIHALDINKNEIWFQPDKFPRADFHIVDIDGDGKTDLVGLHGMRSVIRDKKTGNVIKEIKIDGWRKEILIYEDAKKNKNIHFFDIYENKLKVADINNKVILESQAPLSEIKVNREKLNRPPSTPINLGNGRILAPVPDQYVDDSVSIYEPKAVWVKLQKDKPKYLAIVGRFIGIPRSNFYVYDEKGNLIYHELLPEEVRTIAVNSIDNSSDEIFIGGKEKILKFVAK